MADKITTIDLMRHGECEGGNILRGSTDVALSSTGWNNMQKVAETCMTQHSWQQIISSPLKRCQQFAESFKQQHNIALSICNDFRELDYGDWDGMDSQHLWEIHKEEMNLLYNDPLKFKAPHGESMLTFQQRVIDAWQQILTQFIGQRLLLIQHGGTIRVLIAHLLSLPLSSVINFNIPYACLTRFEIYHHESVDHIMLMFHQPPAA